MEDDEKVRYTFMTAIVFFVFQSTWSGTLGLELFKWVSLVTGLVLLIALILFALDGIVLNMIPDSLAKLIAWLGVLLAALVILLAWLTNAAYLNITLP